LGRGEPGRRGKEACRGKKNRRKGVGTVRYRQGRPRERVSGAKAGADMVGATGGREKGGGGKLRGGVRAIRQKVAHLSEGN